MVRVVTLLSIKTWLLVKKNITPYDIAMAQLQKVSKIEPEAL